MFLGKFHKILKILKVFKKKLDTKEKKYYNNKVAIDETIWELSSAGRASALQAEGHRFEPYSSHWYGRVVQLVRMPACHAGGRGFEPLLGRHLVCG